MNYYKKKYLKYKLKYFLLKKQLGGNLVEIFSDMVYDQIGDSIANKISSFNRKSKSKSKSSFNSQTYTLDLDLDDKIKKEVSNYKNKKYYPDDIYNAIRKYNEINHNYEEKMEEQLNDRGPICQYVNTKIDKQKSIFNSSNIQQKYPATADTIQPYNSCKVCKVILPRIKQKICLYDKNYDLYDHICKNQTGVMKLKTEIENIKQELNKSHKIKMQKEQIIIKNQNENEQKKLQARNKKKLENNKWSIVNPISYFYSSKK